MADLLSPAPHYPSPVLPDVPGSAEHYSDTMKSSYVLSVASVGLTRASLSAVAGWPYVSYPHTCSHIPSQFLLELRVLSL